MISKLKVYYNGWGEHWHWASLWLTDPRTQNIAFKYTPEAINKGPNGYHQMSVMGEALTVEKNTGWNWQKWLA